MRIGAHVPARGGLMGAIEAARACKAEAVQIWGSNPRAWALPSVPDARAEEFRAAWRSAAIGPLFLHSPYMVNVASPNDEFRTRSVDLARATVMLAERIGADGVVVHAGAGGVETPRPVALERAAESLGSVAREARRTWVLVELMAGTAGSVASTFGEARELMDAAHGHRRLGLCIDTCHLFAAGYGLDTQEGVAACFDEVRRAGLTRRLRLIHANDSAFGRGERRDRHTSIGRGQIGESGFAAILAHPVARRLPFVCETPGRIEDHARDIATLRRLAGPEMLESLPPLPKLGPTGRGGPC